jgi:hypothetical protein
MSATTAPNESALTKSQQRGRQQGGAEGASDDSPARLRHIYEQDKLEAVFREAREDLSTPHEAPGAQSTDGSGSFAFGFQVGEGSDKGGAAGSSDAPAASSSFAFAFGLGNSEPAAEDGDPIDVDVGANDGDSEIDDGPRVKRRCLGSAFSEEELDSYIHRFLTGNGGDRILADVDEWRKDESLKAQWVKERTQLTLDWKRKHKAAKARSRNSGGGKS